MSRSPSDDAAAEAAAEPLRPSDHVDGDDSITQPRLGFVGWIRWGWRQLTSMRTALVLLLLLAIAAVPGSIVPQRSADPNGVTQYFTDNPELAPILDNLQLFDVYTSAWFSAIYLLLFVSLIGCIIPRTKHHWKALRAQPPRTPARLARLDDYLVHDVPVPASPVPAPSVPERASSRRDAPRSAAAERDGGHEAAHAIDLAEAQLKSAGYRTARYDRGASASVSAERGYMRETGNLVFHAALVGVLISVGIGGGFTYTGQRVVIEGTSFVNALTDYSSFNPGRFVNTETLTPYTMTLDRFDVSYQPFGTNASGMAGDFVAHVTTQLVGEDAVDGDVRVNHPLSLGGDKIYLLGNGYAPTVTIRNPAGETVFHDSVAFLPQDTNMTSLGVIKVPDGLPEQLGLVGFFYPTQFANDTGAFTSVYPDLVNPVMTLNVYAGDLGIDGGTPRSVYTLDPSGMQQLTGGATGVDSLELAPGETAALPNDWGTITFDSAAPAGAAGYEDSVKRFVSLSIHRDAGAAWVLVFSVLAILGLLVALFVPRRRMWVKATARPDGIRVEYAGLARGEDPALAAAVDQLAARHQAAWNPGSDPEDDPQTPRVQ